MPWKDHLAKLRLTDSWILFFYHHFCLTVISLQWLIWSMAKTSIIYILQEAKYIIWWAAFGSWERDAESCLTVCMIRIDRLHVRNGKSTESHFVRLNPVYLSSLLWVFSICCHLVLWPKVICTDQLFWQYRVMFHAPINAACWENTEKHEWVSRSVSLRKYEWVSF